MLTFEEISTVLSQIEACLNSRPLAPLNTPHVDGIDVLTQERFFYFAPKALGSLSNLVRHFWQRWSSDYLTSINKYSKWKCPNRSIQSGDLVIFREDSPFPTKWPLGQVCRVYEGKDGLARVAMIKTASGSYKRPVTKLALILPVDEDN